MNGVARPRFGPRPTYVKATPLRNDLEASPPLSGPLGGPGPKKGPGLYFWALYVAAGVREAQFTLV